jgi:hypothetical protein
VLHRLIGTLRNSWTEFYKGDFLDYYCTGHQVLIVSTDLARAVRSFAWRCLQPLLSALHRIAHYLRPLVLRTPASVVVTEAQPLDQDLHAAATKQCLLKLELPDTPTSSLEAPSIK